MHYVVFMWTLVRLPEGKIHRTRQTIRANDLRHANALARALEEVNSPFEHSCTVMAGVRVPTQGLVYLPVTDLAYFADEVKDAAVAYAKDSLKA